jgi:hypothetical protein
VSHVVLRVLEIVIPLLVGVAGVLPLTNGIRRARGEPPVRGAEARNAVIRFAVVFVPLGALVLILLS